VDPLSDAGTDEATEATEAKTEATATTPDTAEEASPKDEAREALLAEITSDLTGGVVESYLMPGTDLWIRVATDSWADVGRALHGRGFTFFSFLSGIDWMPSPYGRGEDDPTAEAPVRETETKQGYAGGETRFQVFARLVDLDRRLGVTIKADVPDDTMTVGSWVTIFAGANWHEREAHEMFGINFDGHPDLRNLYLPGDFEGHPLRKDFPLLARMIKPWPGIVDVEPLPTEDEAPPNGETAPSEGVLHAPADESAVTAAEQTPDTQAQQEQQAESSEAEPSETGDTA
jgi:NADH-quinone oxidoreductase subunit C